MPTLVQRFQHHLEAGDLIPAGSRGLVAVSGGADSTALLHLLHGAAARFGLELHAAHLDHALRPDSPADAAHVRALCATLQIPVTVARMDVAALARGRRGGLEEAAREARRDFLRATAQARDCTWIALAHQRDDQAETFLLRLLRGAGTTGLAGMRPWEPPFVRPLLPFARLELVDWLAVQGIPWREDPSNQDPAFARNRVRSELLPLLESYNPAIRVRLAELCRQLAADEMEWRHRVALALEGAVERREAEWRLPCAVLAAMTPALAGRAVRVLLEEVRGSLRRLDARHVAAVLALASGRRPQGELHLPGAWVGRRYTTLLLRRAAPRAVALKPFAIPGPGCYPLPDGRMLAVSIAPATGGDGARLVEFDAGQVAFPLEVRGPRPGDRLRPAGMTGRRKLQDLFVDHKLPIEMRIAAVLVCGAGQLLWIAGLRRCAGLEPLQPGGTALRLELVAASTAPPQSA